MIYVGSLLSVLVLLTVLFKITGCLHPFDVLLCAEHVPVVLVRYCVSGKGQQLFRTLAAETEYEM